MKASERNDERGVTLTDGSPVTPNHRDIDPATGQQKGYVVLSAEERAKGFVRPLRLAYQHVGNGGPKHPTRELTAEEQEQYRAFGYVLFEEYPRSDSCVTGRFWTRQQLDAAKGCGARTHMALPLAETYARDPKFYSGTFCSRCREHFPVSEFVWDGTSEVVGS